MSHVNRISHAVSSFVVLLLCAVFMHTPAQAAITLNSIAVTPTDSTLSVGLTQAFTATGTYSDGSALLLDAPVEALAAGSYHTCALRVSGAVQCWGDNTRGQLGNDSTTLSIVPVKVSGISTATAVAAGGGSQLCAARQRRGAMLGV